MSKKKPTRIEQDVKDGAAFAHGDKEAKIKAMKSQNDQRSKGRSRRAKNFSNGKNLKKDDLSVKGGLSTKGFVNNPNWYFKDANQAEVMSRFPMSGFGAVTKAGNEMLPTVMAFYLNPSVGVVEYNPNDPVFIKINGPTTSKALGINRAAQKLWYILTAKSGRAAGYSKANVAMLIGAIGAMIETYEFIRRVFGIAYTYNQRNRALPDMLWNAMHVSADDYKLHAADYLKRMNTLMAVMNQLPIPGNIAWFAKCQDMYQHIFMDYPAEMAQLFINCPSTTWVLEEDDGFIGGAYLKTVDMCITHVDLPNALYNNPAYGLTSTGTSVHPTTTNPYYLPISHDANGIRVETKTLGNYIDVFEDQINRLLFSSHFSMIYADILRAFDTGNLSRWAFDYIDEKYVVVPEYNEGFLWQIHNADVAYGIMSPTRTYWQAKWTGTQTYDDVAKYGTPCNDVYEWGLTDTLLYNPNITSYARYDSGLSSNVIIDRHSKILDFPNDQPTTEERVELTRYCITPLNDYVERPVCDDSSVDTTRYAFNYNLPDHWIELGYLYFGYQDAPKQISESVFLPAASGAFATMDNAVITSNEDVTKFHHAPILEQFHNYGTLTSARLNIIYGELNAWTEIKPEWFKSIANMIYVDLFDIR